MRICNLRIISGPRACWRRHPLEIVAEETLRLCLLGDQVAHHVTASHLASLALHHTMDDYDAYLYSIDDPELSEEGESDNNVLDNIDEDQFHTDTAVVLVPASPPTREGESGNEKQPEPSSMVSQSMRKCNRSVNI